MAVLANAFETYDAVGNREDLTDIIYNIDPIDCPVMSSIGRAVAHAVTHEWQTDTLDTPAFNVVDEGNDAVFATPGATLRIQNTAQISEKLVAISGTQEAVDKAGRASEIGYQLARLSKSLKRDMEFTITQNQALVTGSSGTPRALGSYENWIDGANASRGAGAGADATFDGTGAWPTTAPTDGTARPLLESMLKGIIQQVWTEGGDATLVVAGPFNKTIISTFTGNATRFDRSEDMSLTAAIDLYISDFGRHKIVADRFSRDESVLVITPSMLCLSYLRPFKQIPLAKTGDTEKRLMNVEYTLQVKNRDAHGIVADLATS